MANRTALLLLGGIVVTATRGGAAIGVYVGDGGPLLGGGAGEGGDSTAPTPTVRATGPAAHCRNRPDTGGSA